MAETHQQPPHIKTRATDDESQQGPSTSQVLAVVTLFPVGGFLLFLAAATLVGTLVGAALATPVFLLFSPILVPAVLGISASVVGFITSGALGITALSSVSWLLNYLRRMKAQGLPEQLRQRVGGTARHVGQKAQEGMKP